MKRLLVLLPIAAIAAALAASSAIADPSPLNISIGGQAQYVSVGEILLPVTYNCPTSAGMAEIDAQVFEQSTGGQGFTNPFFFTEPCTGRNASVVLDVFGGPFTVGKAFASSTVIGATTFQTVQRQIQIVL
jgi:hypothetical protein